MKVKGTTFSVLTKPDRVELYESVLYEIASTFCIPPYQDDPELKESVYMRVMISIRNLTHLFTFDEVRDYHPKDVFAWQFFDDILLQNTFKGAKNSPGILPADLSKISKQIAHIARDRPSYQGAAKRWKVELREKLQPHSLGFIDCLVRHNAAEIDPRHLKGFQRLARELRYKTASVRPDFTAISNTAFVVTTIDLDPTPSDHFSIVRFLN